MIKYAKVIHNFMSRSLTALFRKWYQITKLKSKTIYIKGDLHGQFIDLYTIFELNSLPSSSNIYLFNGDFVDRYLVFSSY